MLQAKTIVRDSPIHGRGLFAAEPITAGTLVWRYERDDNRIPIISATEEILTLGYINPRNPDFVIVCGDSSRFINFRNGSIANLYEVISSGEESDLIAARNIPAGEELTVEPSTDSDYERKLGIT